MSIHECPSGSKGVEDQLLESSRAHQPVWSNIYLLEKTSKPKREPLDSSQCQLESEAKKYFVESVQNNNEGVLSKAYAILTSAFAPEEVESEDILIARVERESQPSSPYRYKHMVHIVRDEDREINHVLVSTHLDLREADQKPTGETMLAIGYSVTPEYSRRKGLAKEAYISALIDAGLEAETWGKKLVLSIGECTSSSEPFWNSVGLRRAYGRARSNIWEYTEVPYLQPPHKWDNEGNILEGAGSLPEHLMMQRFDSSALDTTTITEAVQAMYEELYIQPPEMFGGNGTAYAHHRHYLNKIEDGLKQFLSANGQLILLDAREREDYRRQGLTIHNYEAADQG